MTKKKCWMNDTLTLLQWQFFIIIHYIADDMYNTHV